jgi:hypothetical protein
MISINFLKFIIQRCFLLNFKEFLAPFNFFIHFNLKFHFQFIPNFGPHYFIKYSNFNYLNFFHFLSNFQLNFFHDLFW